MGGSLADWFLTERGIRKNTLDAWGVRLESDRAVFPYTSGEKTRVWLADGRRQFFYTQGVAPPLYKLTDAGPWSPVVFLVEGETDTLRLYQELVDEGSDASVVGLSGIHTWKAEYADAFASCEQVFVVLDNDPDYNVAAKVDAAWLDIRRDIGPKARRLRLPNGVKDLCEFFQGYDLEALRSLSLRIGPSQSRYRPLDLSKEPPAPDWLLENLIAKGDVTLLVGDGGLGKSWFTMGLTLAIAEQQETYLGMNVSDHGRVLYVDEENPEDVIYHRLNRLGLTREGAGRIRYLNNEGIRLDRRPEEFREEALDYNPSLIVLDSLTRLHTDDENNAGAMSKLYNDGVIPLARETGAAVVLIHHTNKGGGNAYARSRGSTDITYGVDAGIDVRPTEPYQEGAFTMRLFRSRRRKGGDQLVVSVVDQPDGSATLDFDVPPPPPF